MKTCKTCDKTKELTEYHTAGTYKGNPQYRGSCKECTRTELKSDVAKDRQKKYRASDKYKKIKKEYRSKQYVKDKENKRRIEQYYEDRLYAVKLNIRVRTALAIKAKDWTKTTTFTEYIGCSLDELKLHLEQQFIEGMTWDNYGKWEIDHKIPLSSALTEKEMIKLAHYTNLQPLWAEDNLKKSDKMPGEY